MPSSGPPKPFVIPVFIPHAGCPHRCIFCNQTRTAGQPERLPAAGQLETAIERFLGYRKDAERHTEISFYGGNFLGLSEDNILYLIKKTAQYVSGGQANGIRFSTRPDTVDDHRIQLIAPFPVSTVELGVQSMNDQVLATAGRGHTAGVVHDAVALLREHPYRLGLQMMVGLPGDTPETALATAETIAGLKPDFVRIYPTLVLKGSRLARWYRQGRYKPLSLDKAVGLVKTLYTVFAANGIQVIRMGLQATAGFNTGRDLLTGPYHPAFGERVHSALWLDTLRREIGALRTKDHAIEIQLNPKLISRIRGERSRNMKTLVHEFGLSRIGLSPNASLALDRIILNGGTCLLFK